MQNLEIINHLIATSQRLAATNAEIIRRVTNREPLSLPIIQEYTPPPIDHTVYSSQFSVSLN